MTLEEKISQMGSSASGIPRLGIQKYDWCNEGLHGVARAGIATVFPQAIGMAASFDRDMMLNVANVISDEARAKHHEAQRNKDYGAMRGLTFWSPNINIFRDPRWGRGHETYGEDPYLTGQMGIQFVKGLQGNDPKYLKLVATPKHFAVHSGPEGGRSSFNVDPTARDLWETYLPAFEDLIVKAKAYSVMGAYNSIYGKPSNTSKMLLDDILRKKWGFDGYVVSDCQAIQNVFLHHKIVKTPEEASALGVTAGCDLECGSVYQKSLYNAVQKGYIKESDIDIAVNRLMLARMKLGMFDPDKMVKYAQIPISVNDSKKNDEVALEMAQKSMTLLKNNGVLPLDITKMKSIAVVGPNANSLLALKGNYYGDFSHPVTVLEGIKKVVGNGVEVNYSLGCEIAEPDNKALLKYAAVDSKYLYTTDKSGKKINGVEGHYFRGKELKGEPVIKRIDNEVKFNWGYGSPSDVTQAEGTLTEDQKIEGNDFSARWKAKLVPPVSGVYKLGVTGDDGCRVFVDGKLIADGWSDHGMLSFVSDIELEAGKSYDVVIEYYESASDAGVTFVWELPKSGNEDPFIKMLNDVKKADVAIFVGGIDGTNYEREENPEIEGIDGFYHGDRTKIELPKIQVETIKAMLETGTPVVLVLMTGSAIAFDEIDNKLSATLMSWYPGQRGGDAVAKVLFGKYNPAGRLPITLYKSTDELGDFNNYNLSSEKGKTYRFYKGEALYPFGHGLNYTAFKYSNLVVSQKKNHANKYFTVSFELQNTGDKDGEEVVQLYIKDVKSDKVMPVKQLRKFDRIALKVGAKKNISFEINPIEDLRYYDETLKKYVVEPGDFEIMVGASSKDIRLQETIQVLD